MQQQAGSVCLLIVGMAAGAMCCMACLCSHVMHAMQHQLHSKLPAPLPLSVAERIIKSCCTRHGLCCCYLLDKPFSCRTLWLPLCHAGLHVCAGKEGRRDGHADRRV